MILVCFEHKFYFLCIKSESQKIVNFLDTTSDDKDLPRSDLCNYSDPYIAVKGVITIVRPYGSKRNKKVAFKKDAPNCISEINGVNIDNAEDLDVVMPMYN